MLENSTATTTAGTRRRGRPAQLSRDLVLQEAARHDLRHLSIRGLAARLRCSDAAIHYHFRGRDDLLRALVERFTAEFEAPADTLAWPDWLHAFALALRAALARHPGAADYMVVSGPSGAGQFAVMARGLAVLEAGGFTPDEAWLAYATLVNFVLRHVQAEERALAAGDHAPARRMLDARADRLVALTARGVVSDTDRLFAFGLDALLRGFPRPAGRGNAPCAGAPAGP
ncbi:TetR/AcrR family transcriptional regulator C-terminal domain-containing protein [Phenylobacterium sp.]|uniref:TetR/AcrR family transcriptional regulator n=1 Tax=Phenylobacterium sp. TaxID=1871053 RepID=UPI00301E10FC